LVQLRLGIDLACRAAHQASLADDRGEFIWTGRRFHTSPEELERLWAMLPDQTEPAGVTVIMEPTPNAWVPLAAWFGRHGATVVLVPPEQAADLRAYDHKHTKTDRLDSRLLARLPLLHPDGLHPAPGLGPGDVLRRTTKLRATLVKRRTTTLSRLDALVELLGPGWLAAFRGDLANKTPLRFLAAGSACPYPLKRLGVARVGRFRYRHSRGVWGEQKAAELLAAAEQTLALWAGELDHGELADDLAVQARVALQLTHEIHELDERIKLVLDRRDPAGIMTFSAGRGADPRRADPRSARRDPGRFRSLAGVRCFSGLVPSQDASGVTGKHGGPTKAGDAVLREALLLAADHARRLDPTLAARYQRLMVQAGKHHNSALCHIATALLTRMVPAGGAASPPSSATPTADPSPPRKDAASSPSATRSPASFATSCAPPAPLAVPTTDEPVNQGVAERSVTGPPPPPHRPQPSLTAIRNSTAPSSPARRSPATSKSSASASTGSRPARPTITRSANVSRAPPSRSSTARLPPPALRSPDDLNAQLQGWLQTYNTRPPQPRRLHARPHALAVMAAEQAEWVEELEARTTAAPPDSPAACIVDTGVHQPHPLISDSLEPADCHACDPNWQVGDHHGHGPRWPGSPATIGRQPARVVWCDNGDGHQPCRDPSAPPTQDVSIAQRHGRK
jgi:transposase